MNLAGVATFGLGLTLGITVSPWFFFLAAIPVIAEVWPD